MKRLFIGMLLTAAATGAMGEVTYFEDVRDLKGHATEFLLFVDSVTEGLPAANAGLHAGDSIVGVDGLRVRTPAEYGLVRFYFGDRPDMTLTVLRHGVLMNIRIADVAPVRRGGLSWSRPYNRFLEKMLEWGIESVGGRPVFRDKGADDAGAAGDNGAVAELFNAFNVQNPRVVGQAGRLIAMFPGRGWEAIARLMDGGNEAQGKWCRTLLDVYMHLRYRERDKARELMTRARLVETAPDPFLKDLADFYSKIIEAPPQWGAAKIWQSYGVDLMFFVVCYPYPVLCEESGKGSFAFDPDFQKVFDLATDGAWVDRSEISEAANRYAQSRRDGPAEDASVDRFLDQIRASLIDRDRHGGWPSRSSQIYEKAGRDRILAKLDRRLAEKPDERILTAFAILCPSMIAKDFDQFSKVYRILFAAGPRERAIANDMIPGAARMWSADQRYRQLIQECEMQEQKPAFYEYMEKTSPGFRFLAQWGSCRRYGDRIIHPTQWVSDRFHDVAAALEQPATEAGLEAAWQAASTEKTAAAVRKAFAAVCLDLYSNPRQTTMDRFVSLAVKMPAGDVLDAATRVFGNHLCRMCANQIDVGGLFTDWMWALEAKDYNELAKQIDGLTGTGPAMKEQAAELYRRAGVPSVCILLARKLREAGEADEASVYVRKATVFFESLTGGYTGSGYRSLRRLAYRDLVSVPGFGEHAGRYRDETVSERTDAGYVLAAINDLHAGRIAAVIADLTMSLAKTVTVEGSPYVYDGRFYRRVAELRQAVLCNVVRQADLSTAQLTALSDLPGINMDAVVAELQKAGARRAEGPLQCSVDVVDGPTVFGVPVTTSIVVRTSYATMTLPFAKIRSVTFREDRGPADVRLRNGDVVRGIVELATLKLKGPSIEFSVKGESIRTIAAYSSQTDRFCAHILQQRVKTESQRSSPGK